MLWLVKFHASKDLTKRPISTGQCEISSNVGTEKKIQVKLKEIPFRAVLPTR
jgi:hypothetical protein